MSSRAAYGMLGAAAGLFYGLLLLIEPDPVGLGLWPLAITGAAGAILGLVLHATQHWEAHGPAGNLLRWSAGLGLAGLVLGLVIAAAGGIPFGGVPAAIACGLVFGLGFGLELQYQAPFGGGYPERSSDEVLMLWTALLGTLALAVGLFAISWYLTT